MKHLIYFIFLITFSVSYAQRNGGRPLRNVPLNNASAKQNQDGVGLFATQSDTTKSASFKFDKTTIDQYKIITLAKDTTYVDTSLTIKNEYKHNYLRRDNFGLLQFSNEGHVYNTFDYNLVKHSATPQFGFTARQAAYLEVEDINYYNVATPYTELYYKSVMQRGHSLDAFVTANLNPNFNLGIGYKGLRSTGKYFNELTSNGNFKLLGSYNTTNKRYFLKAHITAQDFSSQENGGLSDLTQFEDPDGAYTDEARRDVYLESAKSLFKGNRYFFDHIFRLSKTNPNSMVVHHQFNYENKSYEFTNTEVSTRFGDYYNNTAKDKTRYNRMYNQVGVAYANQKLGSLKAYFEDINYNYYYKNYIYTDTGLIPNNYSTRINTLGANYFYQVNNWKIFADAQLAINGPSTNQIQVRGRYKISDKNTFEIGYQNMSKLPNLNYVLHQSSYTNYNWYNNFKNEKINAFSANLATQWINLEANYKVLKDHLYFTNTDTNLNADGLASQLLVKPTQYANTITYLSIKANKEFAFGKFGSDHTLLYQKVDQNDSVLNLPDITTRHSIFYNNYFFNKALYLQTGATVNYFTKYYANDYNPILGEMTVQSQKEIGNYPTFDYFINAKIKTFRLFFKAENINSAFTKANDFYAAPNYPYRSFMIRFGVIWTFFS